MINRLALPAMMIKGASTYSIHCLNIIKSGSQDVFLMNSEKMGGFLNDH